MTGHTLGPWTAKMSKYREGVLVVQAGMPSNRVLAKFGSTDEPLDETDVANARLIAAAPDLLDNARKNLATMQVTCLRMQEYGRSTAELDLAISETEQAIWEATGTQPTSSQAMDELTSASAEEMFPAGILPGAEGSRQ